MEEIFFNGEYRSALAQLPNRPTLIVDLGANVGYSARYWHQHFPDAKIVAVEPDAENARLCRDNIQSAGAAESIDLVECCVGAIERRVHLESNEGEWAFHMVNADSEARPTIPVKTLPQILVGYGDAARVDLLKCDIEGAEAELFGSCNSWIHRVENIVVELHAPYSEMDFLRDLEQAGARFTVVCRSKSASRPVLLLSRTGAR